MRTLQDAQVKVDKALANLDGDGVGESMAENSRLVRQLKSMCEKMSTDVDSHQEILMKQCERCTVLCYAQSLLILNSCRQEAKQNAMFKQYTKQLGKESVALETMLKAIDECISQEEAPPHLIL